MRNWCLLNEVSGQKQAIFWNPKFPLLTHIMAFWKMSKQVDTDAFINMCTIRCVIQSMVGSDGKTTAYDYNRNTIKQECNNLANKYTLHTIKNI